MSYSGRVYDGPWEGRQIAHDRPWYEFNWTDGGSVMDFVPLAMMRDAVSVSYRRLEYRWSYALRAWVFVWPSR